MDMCADNHEELCYDCYSCPLCAEKTLSEYKISNLEYEISRLETELNMARQ